MKKRLLQRAQKQAARQVMILLFMVGSNFKPETFLRGS
jgi:hypothetical protein